MQDTLELIVYVVQQDLPLSTLINPNGTNRVAYTIDMEGAPLNIVQNERPQANPPPFVPKGTALNILLAPPLDGDQGPRRAVMSHMSKTGLCPKCGAQDVEIGAVLAEPDWWACIDCVTKEVQSATHLLP